ncbi:MAG: aminotransferase class V-fold PLP-dependent enzyme [Bacteroidota bacterium]
METLPTSITPEFLRSQTLGIDAPIQTPFGERRIVYADFTASGRQLAFLEDHLRDVAAVYANAHTEDSVTGRTATRLLHEAEAAIKRAVGAGPTGKVICCGNGSTSAIHKLQQLLGIAIPPATLREVADRLDRQLVDEEAGGRLAYDLREQGPVVFVGPMEHHSNEITWREGLCTTVEIQLDAKGQVDLADLEQHLTDPRWKGRCKIGSFCAGSNVTGILAPVHDIARLLHAYDALAVFDYAASGPYVEIDMSGRGDSEARLDAVFLSPHKFLGGPGSSGVLVFDEAIYPHELAPSVGGGGTVVYVNETYHDYIDDIEARETPGTPGLFQVLRAAYALDIKDAIGADTIHQREHAHLERALARWRDDGRIDILGSDQPVGRIGIVSFNVLDGVGGVLHPRFVTVLLDDLFGIQSRAGCSCAGPYGHRLLNIGPAASAKFRASSLEGLHGLKPGWARVGFHYSMDDAEADFVADAVLFVAEHGARFLPQYAFDVESGAWSHRRGRSEPLAYGLAAALNATPTASVLLDASSRRAYYADALNKAHELASALEMPDLGARIDGQYADLQFFALA